MDNSEKDALDFFEPYFSELLQCQNTVNEKFKNLINAEDRYRIEPRSYSSCLNDLMVSELKEVFQDVPIVNALRKYAQTTFLYDNTYRIKCKKMDEKFRLAFIPTQLSMDFLAFNIQLTLPSMPAPVTNLILGYQLNNLHTEISKIFLAYPDGKDHYRWIREIPPTTGEEVRVMEPVRVTPGLRRQVKLRDLSTKN